VFRNNQFNNLQYIVWLLQKERKNYLIVANRKLIKFCSS
jgi:hypothetical protein